MNFLDKDFSTIEEGEKKLSEAFSLRDKMGGALYYSALTDDCREIAQKLEQIKKQQPIINN